VCARRDSERSSEPPRSSDSTPFAFAFARASGRELLVVAILYERFLAITDIERQVGLLVVKPRDSDVEVRAFREAARLEFDQDDVPTSIVSPDARAADLLHTERLQCSSRRSSQNACMRRRRHRILERETGLEPATLSLGRDNADHFPQSLSGLGSSEPITPDTAIPARSDVSPLDRSDDPDQSRTVARSWFMPMARLMELAVMAPDSVRSLVALANTSE